VLAAFADDASVTDQGRTWRGRAEIRRWCSGPAKKDRSAVEIIEARRTTSHHWVVTVSPTGDPPRGRAELLYRFAIRDGKITSLKIAP
jgi:hypothetical protein